MENSNSNIDLIRSHVDTIILRSLLNEDKYGLEILNDIKEKSQGMYTLKQPTLYSCLKRLEKIGYIKAYKGDISNGAQRVYYSLLEDGRNFVLSDLHQWEFSRTIINSLLSDKEFDPNNAPPFDPTAFRPLTKRSMVRSDSVDNSQDEIEIENDNDKIIGASDSQHSMSNMSNSEFFVKNNCNNIADDSQPVNYQYYSANTTQQDNTNQQNNNYSANNTQQSYNYSENNTQQDNNYAEEDNDYQYSAEENAIKKQRIDAFIAENNEKAKEVAKNNLNSDNSDISYNAYGNAPVETNKYSQDIDVNSTAPSDGYQKSYVSPTYTEQPRPSYESNPVNYISSFSSLFSNNSSAVAEPQKQEHGSNDDNYDFLTLNEMKSKFSQEGYVIKPYIKKNTTEFYHGKYYFDNKLLFASGLLFYILYAIELISIHFTVGVANGVHAGAFIALLLVPSLYPIACLAKFLLAPAKRTLAKFNLKNALINSLIVLINCAILIILIGYFGFHASVSDINSMILPVIAPLCMLLNVPIDIFIYSMLYKSKIFHLK